MQGKILIIISLLLLSACSVFRKGTTGEEAGRGRKGDNVSLLNTARMNLTGGGFFISKAEVSISGQELDEKILCTIKYNYPGIYLISLRSRTGIEAARLFVSNDTVLINDRMNRQLYYGSNKELHEKYGFNNSTIPLVFGDYLDESAVASEQGGCYDGMLRKRNVVGATIVDYIIDCRFEKPVFASAGADGQLNLSYSDFRKFDNIVIPATVEIEDNKRKLKIFLKIEKIEYPWEGSIEFIPGSGYEMIPLL